LVGGFNHFVAASKEKTRLAAVQGFFWAEIISENNYKRFAYPFGNLIFIISRAI